MPHRELALLTLAGTEAEMGRQHGALARDLDRYARVVEFYPRMPELFLTQGLDVPSPVLRRAIRKLTQLAAARLRRDRPEYARQRAESFFRTLGQPELERSVFVMDVVQNAIGLMGRYGLLRETRIAPPALAACSSLVVWGSASNTGRLLHGRNFDFPGQGVWDLEPAVVFCAPERGLRYGFVTTQGADVPGITGFNEAGLAVNFQTRFSRHVRFAGLGAVDLGHEILRRARTLAEACRIARERPIASSWGITISSAVERRAAVLECHAKRLAVVEPRPGEEHLVQTNRYLDPAMREGEVAPTPSLVAHSDFRYHGLLASALEELPLDARGVGELMASHRDPDAPTTKRTLGGCLAQPDTVQRVVFDLEGGEVWVSIARCGDPGPVWARMPIAWDSTATTRYERLHAPETHTPAEQAYQRYVAACQWSAQAQGEEATAHAIEAVLALAPDDPSYLAAQGGLALRRGAFGDALTAFERSLENEHSPYRRGQWHLWASRAAAAAGLLGRAREHRREVLATTHAHLAAERLEAARDGRGESRSLRKPTAVRVQLETLDFGSLA